MVSILEEAAAEAQDTLLIYYAGHGLVSSTTGGLYLAAADADQDRPHSTALSYDVIRDLVSRSRARRSVVVLDCCYSGRAALMGPMTGMIEAPSTYMIAATGPTHAALAPKGESHTAFTGALIDVLRNGVVDGPELLDIETIYRAVRQRALTGGFPQPLWRATAASPLAIRHNVAWRPPQIPADTNALWNLAVQLEEAGDHAGAEALYLQAADRGDTNALRALAVLREQANSQDTFR
jgi:peptide/nickel transport system substrate-binding protein